MKSKTPFIWALIGLIVGFFTSLNGIVQYLMFKSSNQGFFNEISNSLKINFEAIMTWKLISSILGLVLSVLLIFYVIKLSKTPTKKEYIVTTVLGGLGTFLGIGLGGILVLVGGIMGIVNLNKQESVSN
ncbi:hypothetical protein GYA25_03030 [Candidatus Woesearchaeota archaeon]|jgi:hypothetical protein|nr:hypothetical protein [Candidatus Woesearchaeota archaeon]